MTITTTGSVTTDPKPEFQDLINIIGVEEIQSDMHVTLQGKELPKCQQGCKSSTTTPTTTCSPVVDNCYTVNRDKLMLSLVRVGLPREAGQTVVIFDTSADSAGV